MTKDASQAADQSSSEDTASFGPVISPQDVTLDHRWSPNDQFGGQARRLGPLWGMRHLGCRVVEIEPGKRGWPFHNHYGNDEMFVIVSGRGELRLGDQRHAVSPGQVIGVAAGGSETAHQLINTGDEPLRYLAISSMNTTDIAHYPDSDKWGFIAGSAPGEDQGRTLTGFFAGARQVDYWLGEADAEPDSGLDRADLDKSDTNG